MQLGFHLATNGAFVGHCAHSTASCAQFRVTRGLSALARHVSHVVVCVQRLSISAVSCAASRCHGRAVPCHARSTVLCAALAR
jgi:hypothetical protein